MAPLQRIAPLAAAALGLWAALLQLLASRGNPPGSIEDDAVQILLARSLRGGAFALPDAGGVPITDPWPGLAALLLPFAAWAEPEWGWLRLLPLAASAACAGLVFVLARRRAGPAAAVATAALFALSPALVSHAGLVVPDVFILACALGAAVLAESSPRAAFALAAWAALLKPQGALLPLCLAFAAAPRLGPMRALLSAAAAYLPLAAWLARNQAAAGSIGYAANWSAQLGAIDPARSVRVLSALFGEALLGIAWAWPAALALLVLGARRLWRQDSAAARLAASYIAAVAALHLTWRAVNPRYGIVFSGLAWLLMAEGTRALASRRAAALAAAAAGVLLASGLGAARRSLRLPPSFQPRTVEWLRRSTPREARVQSLRYNALLLCADRFALPPPLEAAGLEEWREWLALNRIEYVHLERSFAPGGYLPPGLRAVKALEARVAELPAELVFAEPSEGTLVYRLVTGKPARKP